MIAINDPSVSTPGGVAVLDRPELVRDHRVGMIDKGMQAAITANNRAALPYALYLASHADASGELIDSRALAAQHFNVCATTITRWRTALVEVGYLLRYSGGFRGRCLVAVIKRYASDAAAFIARRAQAAAWLHRKGRRAELARKARERSRKKGDSAATPLNSIESSLADSDQIGAHDTTESAGERTPGHREGQLAAMRATLPRGGRGR